MDDKTLFIVIFGSVFCGLGLVFSLVALGIKGSLKNKLKNCTSQTSGTIIDLKRHSSGSSGNHQTSYHPVIQFVTENGKTIVKESSFGGSKTRYQIGQNIKLFYNPDNPDEFYMPDDNIPKILTLVFSLVGIGMILLGVIISVLVYIFA